MTTLPGRYRKVALTPPKLFAGADCSSLHTLLQPDGTTLADISHHDVSARCGPQPRPYLLTRSPSSGLREPASLSRHFHFRPVACRRPPGSFWLLQQSEYTLLSKRLDWSLVSGCHQDTSKGLPAKANLDDQANILLRPTHFTLARGAVSL
jgi:hypothetical protein